jgi:hypothetical protein
MKHNTESFYTKKVFNNLNYRTLNKRFCLSLKRPKILTTKVADTKGADNSCVSIIDRSQCYTFPTQLNQTDDVYIYKLCSEQWTPVCQSHPYYQVNEKTGTLCCVCTTSIKSLFFLWRCIPFAYDWLLHTSHCLCLSYDFHSKLRSFSQHKLQIFVIETGRVHCAVRTESRLNSVFGSIFFHCV